MKYPGHVIKLGERDARIVRAVTIALNRALVLQQSDLRLDPDNAVFDSATKRAVQLFQARHVDAQGRPLKIDGEIGAITWAVLFGADQVPAIEGTSDELLARALRIAAGEEAAHVREVPRNSNKGPEVSAYLKRVGVSPGLPWCAAFVYWCVDEAALILKRANPLVRTAGCLDHWNKAAARGARRITHADASADPTLVKPGMIFIMDFGRGAGHTGFVEAVAGGFVTTLEGNTDASMTREGGGVYRLTRKILDINKGFIDYTGVGAAVTRSSPASPRRRSPGRAPKNTARTGGAPPSTLLPSRVIRDT